MIFSDFYGQWGSENLVFWVDVTWIVGVFSPFKHLSTYILILILNSGFVCIEIGLVVCLLVYVYAVFYLISGLLVVVKSRLISFLFDFRSCVQVEADGINVYFILGFMI
ncbi:hypothetical protein ACOSQ2_014165 [Xanthoceras sorbifolium]